VRCPGGGWAALYAPVFAVGLACSSPERAEAPALPDCEGPLCQPRQADPGGGSGSPADGSAPPGDAAESGSGTITLTVAVTSTTDSAFVAVQPYAAPVLLRLEQADGQQSSTGDTPVLSPASLQASPGVNWLAVIGAGPVRVIAPTLQAVTVDGAAPTRSVRALSWDTLTTLAVDDQLWTPQVGTATVLLVFRRAGMPVRGVTVLTPPGASVAYF
jgi:hypothetical protein